MDEELPDDIKCPVCFEIPSKEIFQCKNGHTVCADCSETLSECPQCRVPYEASKIRNRALESLMDTMKFDCIYKSEGCTMKVRRREISSHSDGCSYGTTFIAFCELLGYPCGYLADTKKLNDILAHFVACHDFIVLHETNLDICLEEAFYLSRSLESKWTPVVMNINSTLGATLLLVNRYNPKDKCISFTCLKLDGGYDVQIKFTIRAKIPSKTPDIIWTSPCVNIKYAEFTLNNHLFRFPAELLLKHYVRDSAIVINCSIERIGEFEIKKMTPETIWTFNVATAANNAEASSSSAIFSMPPTPRPRPSSSHMQIPERRSIQQPSTSTGRSKPKSRYSRHSIAVFGGTREKSDKEKSCKPI